MIQQLELDQIEQFSLSVEAIAKAGNSYIDSILTYCEQTGIELEIIPKLISPALKTKLQNEAQDIHLLKKTGIKKLKIK